MLSVKLVKEDNQNSGLAREQTSITNSAKMKKNLFTINIYNLVKADERLLALVICKIKEEDWFQMMVISKFRAKICK